MAVGGGGAGKSAGGAASPGTGGNIYDTSAALFGGAGGALKDAAALYGKPGITGSAPVAALPANISAGIEGYMNPYTENVVDRAVADQQRLTALQQQQNAAGAVNAGAFGGDRHALVEAATNSEAQRNLGNLTAGLRSSGFNTAAELAGQDVSNLMQTNQFNAGQKSNWALAKAQDALARAAGLAGVGGQAGGLATSGVDIGQTLMGNQAGAGQQQQTLVQNLMNLAGGQYQQFMQRPQSMMDLLLSATGMSPLNQNQTSTSSYQPGLLDWASLAGQAAMGWWNRPVRAATG